MFALLWLLLLAYAGLTALHACVPDLGRSPTLTRREGRAAGRAPALFFTLPAGFMLGVIPFASLAYFIAWLSNIISPDGVYPLLPASIVSALLALAAIVLLGRRYGFPGAALFRRHTGEGQERQAAFRHRGPGLTAFYTAAFLLFLLLGLGLSWYSFRRFGSLTGAGFSVFSDFGPHTALVSSFAKGRNFPADYPHFAGDGIRYHFFFYFLCGNLHYLGLPLDWAINLPSLLGSLSFASILGWMAVRWSGRHSTFLIAPLLLIGRSSTAIFHYLENLPELAAGAGMSAWAYFRQDEVYIGQLPYDNWGLWNLNVYANQRHFLFGMAATLVVLVLLGPALSAFSSFTGPGVRSYFTRGWLSRRAWIPLSWKPYLPAFVLLLFLPYWHGSVTVALLLILFGMAWFSLDKLAYLSCALISIGSAYGMGALFAPGAAALKPEFTFGFIAPEKTLPGVFSYWVQLLGAMAFLILLMPLFQRSLAKRVLAASALLPALFAFTVTLTPDVNVNHKYILISVMLANIGLADGLTGFWHLPERLEIRSRAARTISTILLRVAALLTALVLTATGIVDTLTYHRINRNIYWLPSHYEWMNWIEEETEEDAIFLTPPWAYHSFFLTGRQAWYGHSYYAWSAGHDTSRRLAEQRWVLSGGDGTAADAQAIHGYLTSNGIDYIFITDEFRENPDFSINEDFIAANYAVAARFPEFDNAIIYRVPEA